MARSGDETDIFLILAMCVSTGELGALVFEGYYFRPRAARFPRYFSSPWGVALMRYSTVALSIFGISADIEPIIGSKYRSK